MLGVKCYKIFNCFLTHFITTVLQEDTITEAVAYLQGECFCGQPGHTDGCADLVSTVLPIALPVLGGALGEQATELCQEVVGVC